jgi:hypothetical protein
MVRELMLGPDARTAPFLDHASLTALVERPLARGGTTEPLITVLMLELWLRGMERITPEPDRGGLRALEPAAL